MLTMRAWRERARCAQKFGLEASGWIIVLIAAAAAAAAVANEQLPSQRQKLLHTSLLAK